MARHQHVSPNMLAYRTLHDRRLSPEADPSNLRRPGWWICSWHGFADFHSAASRFHRWLRAPFRSRHRPGRLVHDLEPSVIVLRYADRSGFLPDQFERIQDADL